MAGRGSGMSGVSTIWTARDLSPYGPRPGVPVNDRTEKMTATQIAGFQRALAMPANAVLPSVNVPPDPRNLKDPRVALLFTRDLLFAWSEFANVLERARDRRQKILDLVNSDHWRRKCLKVYARYDASYLPVDFILRLYAAPKTTLRVGLPKSTRSKRGLRPGVVAKDAGDGPARP